MISSTCPVPFVGIEAHTDYIGSGKLFFKVEAGCQVYEIFQSASQPIFNPVIRSFGGGGVETQVQFSAPRTANELI